MPELQQILGKLPIEKKALMATKCFHLNGFDTSLTWSSAIHLELK